MTDVVCLGILVADVITRPVDDVPATGSLGFVDEVALHGGGCALNTASTLARLGLRAAVAGKVGADPFGDFLLDLLDARGVIRDAVVRDPSVPTSSTVVLVSEAGERTFLHAPGASDALTREELDPGLLYVGRALHLAGALVMEGLDGEPFAAIAAEAQRRGVLTSLDTVWDPTGRWARLEPCLAHVDLAVPSLGEGEAVSGERGAERVATWFRDQGVGEVGLTMGRGGAYVSGAGFTGFVDGMPVTAVDDTGAGDAFAAGMLYGKLAGWDLERTARFACALGALATTVVGASDAVPSLDEALALAGIE